MTKEVQDMLQMHIQEIQSICMTGRIGNVLVSKDKALQEILQNAIDAEALLKTCTQSTK